MTEPPVQRMLVVVEAAARVERTVEYALRAARDAQAESSEPVAVDVRVAVASGTADASAVEDRIDRAIAGFGPTVEVTVKVVRLHGDDPRRRTDALLDAVGPSPISRVVVAADTDLSVERLRERVGVTAVDLVSTGASPDRRPLLHPGGHRRLVTVFGLTYLFYLAIGGFVGGLDVLTGALSAGVTALALSNVALREEPTLRRTVPRLGRTVVFLPVLGWEVVKANAVVAAIVLHPSLPIDPSMEVVETDTHDAIERMVLANSVTLTPGTVTVDVRERTFTIHTLTGGARADLLAGRLQRLVAWVFHGQRGSASTDGGGGG
jgi:multisubunit Na+/H+ antiporter MnhE subunit